MREREKVRRARGDEENALLRSAATKCCHLVLLLSAAIKKCCY